MPPRLVSSPKQGIMSTEALRTALVPIAFIALLAVIIIPMSPVIIDLLITVNICIAAIVLLTTVYLEKPLDFSVFPPLLLGTTLFRLALNIATTRLILTADATTPEGAQAVAGQVIRAFGEFVAGDSPIVGAVIFIILVIVQFIVITKGATRIAEVAARFTLDAMPGKQMAIDADLTAGLIDEAEARERRDTVMREADFYGAMDGASKFVRGDAIAGIIITIINIIGGFAVGAIYKGWSAAESLEIFTRLTIGDGLVSQVPSFIIATAAGLVVARSGSKQNFANDLTTQLASQPKALYFTAAFLAMMSVTGMPFVPMIACAIAVAGIAFLVSRGVTSAEEIAKREQQAAADIPSAVPDVDELLKVDLLELEVGYGLVLLVNDAPGGSLLDRIGMLRRQMASDLGLILPPVRIRDNSEVDQHAYRFKLRGATIADGITYPGMWLAMDSGLATDSIDGLHTKEPAFGLDAWWIEDHLRARAESLGYTVVDAATVLMTHFTEVVRNHAEELLTREEVNNLITGLRERAPKLVEEVISDKINPAQLQKVLQSLLREQVSIKDLETILETLADWITHTKDVDVLVEYVRNGLRRTIVANYVTPDDDGKPKLFCVTIDPNLEDLINSYIDRSTNSTTITMPPAVANRICGAIVDSLDSLIHAGRPAVILTSPQIRGPLRQIVSSTLHTSVVLGYNEIPDGLDVESANLVQIPKEDGGISAA